MSSSTLSPLQLRDALGSGLLSFPVTHFHGDLSLDPNGYEGHIAWLCRHQPAALFAAGGTGEFFSLLPDEVVSLVRSAKAVAGRVPILSGCGYGTAMAIEMARAAEAAGADGLLLLPHYLIGAEQEGIYRHVRAVCEAVGLGVIVYNRDNSIASVDTIQRLADACPNLVGYKDGVGDMELVTSITTVLGDRLVYIGGMPTHEGFASAYFGAGVSTYSSAVFNFVPELAQTFFGAMRAGDMHTTSHLLKTFFIPLAAIRQRRNGYAIAMIKAGLRLAGRDPGPVRPPLIDLSVEEMEMLRDVMQGAQTLRAVVA